MTSVKNSVNYRQVSFHAISFSWFFPNIQHSKFTPLLNLCDNFPFNATWHRWSVHTIIFWRRLAESDVSVPPAATCMGLLHWWWNHVVNVISLSKAKVYLPTWMRKINMPSAIQVKKNSKRQSLLKRSCT